jgi:hypothetical protein
VGKTRLLCRIDFSATLYTVKRDRRALALAIRDDRTLGLDPHAPDTLGWRVWAWDEASQRLISPSLKTVWHTAEMRVENWDSCEVLRGVAGIHAARLPLNWRRADVMSH